MTNPPRTSVDLLLGAAEQQPENGIRYCSGGAGSDHREQSHVQLLYEARRLLAGLRARGLRPQDKVVLLLEDQAQFLTAFWAAQLGGFVPCPMTPVRTDRERWAAQLAHVRDLLDGPLVVTDGELARELPEVPGLVVATVDGLLPTGGDPAAEPVHRAAPEDDAVLVLTSGSTGLPKAVRLSHANLLASMAGKNGYHRLTPADTSMNWVSFDHVAALLECHLLPLWAGCRQVHVQPGTVLGEPLEFLRLASEHGVTMTFTPNFLLGLLVSAAERLPAVDLAGLDLSRLRHIVSGGEAVVRATGRAFLAHYAPYGLDPAALWPAFGMTETCAGSVYSLAFPEGDGGREFADLGTPVAGLRIRVADPADRALPEGEVGELQLTGPMITSGYHNDAAATAAAFTADGWFRSGDLGRIDGGRLTLVGRSKDSVIVNGVNYFSHELESVLERLDGVSPSYVAAFPVRPGGDTEQLVVAFHCPLPEEDAAGRYRAMVAVRSSTVMTWGFRPALVLPLPLEAFPKTSLGKIQRSLMRRRLESGGYERELRAAEELTELHLGGHSAPQGEVETALAEIYAELFDTAPERISATASFFDLGGTSLDILRLRGRITARLGVADLPVITLLNAPTVRSLASRLTQPRGLGETAYDPVVPMQTGGDRTPLFCVHPGVGEVLVFVNLARYFVGERPFHALRARGFNEGEKPFRTFEEMVDSYVAAIRARQPHGPYALAGYSFGAAVAFEIAKQLERAGERVGFLGSFNLPPHIKYRMDELDFVETAVNLAFFLALVDKRQAGELPGQLRGLPQDEQIDRLLALAPPARIAELDLDRERFANWADLADRLTDLGRSYRPEGTVRAMTVFHAEPLRGTRADWLEKELRRWDDFTEEDTRYVAVPGEHYTLMGPQHVAAFQAILREELDRAMGADA
ncbi:non-ribosomal peptide synthetase [Kitasatospora sp. NA04385]|uniref:non-ribosomal peptide synthetase n=1 Tax=Kitasatospora sp. NA04385 TaxID=2742135 RepID=UPI001165BC0A|nr:non-ribosomal peptide synthetase [Kitasatospora sp. NA04385]QDJ74293.1 peptide synthetase [Kitasatospora sp.]